MQIEIKKKMYKLIFIVALLGLSQAIFHSNSQKHFLKQTSKSFIIDLERKEHEPAQLIEKIDLLKSHHQ